MLWLLAVLAVLVSGLLIYVMGFGARRRRRLRAFARRLNGESAPDVVSEVQSIWASSDLARGGLVGSTVRFQHASREIMFFDVHPEPGGLPRRTCCLISAPPNAPLDLSEASSSLEGRDPPREAIERYLDLTECLGDDMQSRLEETGWGVRADWSRDHLLVCSNGRALHDADEWKLLLEVAEARLSTTPHPNRTTRGDR